MISEYLQKDLGTFPNLLNWFKSILPNRDYKIVLTKDYYFILKLSKNKICRVEKFSDKVTLQEILKEIDKYIDKPQQVIVPITKPNVVHSFSKNGFYIQDTIKDKYKKGIDVFLMVRE